MLHAELRDVQGTGAEVLQNSQKLRVLWHGHTELTVFQGGFKMLYPTPGIVATVYGTH